MEEEWALHPPVHHLVAEFLGHKPTRPQAAETDDEANDDARPDVWTHAGMGAIPAPAGVRDAATTEEAMAAFERMFFGEVKDVRQL